MSNALTRPISPSRAPRLAGDQQRVPAGVGGDLAALADIGLHDLGQILGRGIAQRHHHRAGGSWSAGGDRDGLRGRHDPVKRPVGDQRSAVLRQQRLRGSAPARSGSAGERCASVAAPADRWVDRVVDLQDRPEDLGDDLSYVGVGEIEADIAGRGVDRRRGDGAWSSRP